MPSFAHDRRSRDLLAACRPAALLLLLVGCAPRADDASPRPVDDAGTAASDGERPDGPSPADDATSSAPDVVPASDTSTGFITEEEWQRRIAPLEGEHDLERHVSQGCPPQRIPQDFRIKPTLACRVRPGNNMVRDCDVEPLCTRHAECEAKPFGACRGSPSARCVYPIDRDVCSATNDCTALPNGFCTPTVTQTHCYPTGRCEITQQRCNYRDEDCSSDADCTTAAGGVCEKRIISVRCVYQGCMDSADCGQGMRCACAIYGTGNVCVPADCRADGDCAEGQECRLELGCHGMAQGYHCSTALDTCRAKEDCGVDLCVFRGSWQCEPKFCPVGP
ncbi:MAG TPA: hypothetical protein VK550_17105 [Polyangiaceae bacterium]|nr:hypothetical protein [Polyangiaceae bacterium]